MQGVLYDESTGILFRSLDTYHKLLRSQIGRWHFIAKTTMQLLVLAFLPLAVLAHNGLPPKEFFDATSAEEFFKFAQSAEDTNGPDERHLIADSTPLLAASFGGTAGFYHGVASGDPLPDAVIVWTRYTPVQATDKIDIELRMAKVGTSNNPAKYLDPAMNPALKRARITVTAANDWIAKIDVTGLEPLTNYVFAFTDGVTTSLVGQAKTAPKANGLVASLTYAVFSCSHFANGYFHAYDIGSTIQDLDFWIHLGDYYVSKQTMEIRPCNWLWPGAHGSLTTLCIPF